MRRKQVENSTSIESIGYSRAKQVLEVEFHSGLVYQYREVPATVHQELTQAESKGKYFAANIRTRYTFEAVGPSDRSENLSWSHHQETASLMPTAPKQPKQDDSLYCDLAAIAEYLRAEHGGRLPGADVLLSF